MLLDFRTPTLVSGPALNPGALYRFSNVATGVDALVSINAITNAALTTIDRDTGLFPNFQPELGLGGGNSNLPRSADFTITLVAAGTSTPLTADFAASGIDIDGDSANLREYAEFSTPFAEYVLETPTRLSVNASGPSVPANFRFESSTSFTAPGIDPTATQNIVSVMYTSTSSFNYRIGTLGTGATNRLTSLDFNCPNINFPAPAPQVNQDFGDAPLAAYGNPIHDILTGVQIGPTNTRELAPYDSPTASADLGDDGVILPVFVRGQSASISVAVSGAGGRLQAWIDWGDDGNFTSGGDQIATDVQDGGAGDADGIANGTIELAVTVPAGPGIGLTFARFRWGTQMGVTSTMTATDGEVEDYALTITATGPPICPPGQTVTASIGNADAVVVTATNSNAALGMPVAPGTPTSNANSARIRSATPTLVLDLTDTVPANSSVEISLAKNNAAGAANIDFSPDNVSWTTITNFNTGALDTLQRISLNGSAGGVRYIRFQRTSGSTHIDAVQYAQVCVGSATMVVSKTVAVYDPSSAGLFAVPGNDMTYTILAQNIGTGPADADSIELIDNLPAEVTFYNGDVDDGGPETAAVGFVVTAGTGLTFTPATDLRYSNSVAPPANFAACTYAPAVGYDPAIRHVCINPKGAMQGGAPTKSFSVWFRAGIQ